MCVRLIKRTMTTKREVLTRLYADLFEWLHEEKLLLRHDVRDMMAAAQLTDLTNPVTRAIEVYFLPAYQTHGELGLRNYIQLETAKSGLLVGLFVDAMVGAPEELKARIRKYKGTQLTPIQLDKVHADLLKIIRIILK